MKKYFFEGLIAIKLKGGGKGLWPYSGLTTSGETFFAASQSFGSVLRFTGSGYDLDILSGSGNKIWADPDSNMTTELETFRFD